MGPPTWQFVGTLRGLGVAANDWLTRLRSGAGDCLVSHECVITFPAVDWDSHWRMDSLSSGSIGVAAASYLAHTVPSNRRIKLVSARAERVSGDNTITGLQITYPAGYGSGSRTNNLLLVATGVTDLTWPQRASTGITTEIMHTPVLLEPGATVTVLLGAAGVAASTFTLALLMSSSPLVRARAPA